MRPKYEVARLIADHGPAFLREQPQSLQVIRTLGAIRDCRTAALGGHKLSCTCCQKEVYRYNSCRNRHCPKCQVLSREKWIYNRERELLPVSYFHLVFTLPHELNTLAMNRPKEVYNALFTAAWGTVDTFSADPKHLGARSGMSAVLHTWGQNLSLHPHLHCIVPGGGLSPSGKWKPAKNKGKYLFPSKALARVFRARFVEALRASGVALPQKLAKAIFSKDWVVYAKQPFLGPKQVIEYLGRYTHKIAISNHRIKNIDQNGTVSFTWKDYRCANQKKTMSLSAQEFLRRFSQHILPPGFVRIRHYGLLASRNKSLLLNRARDWFKLQPWEKPKAQDWKIIAKERMDLDPDRCPFCKNGMLEVVEVIQPRRGPPLKSNIHPNTSFYAA